MRKTPPIPLEYLKTSRDFLKTILEAKINRLPPEKKRVAGHWFQLLINHANLLKGEPKFNQELYIWTTILLFSYPATGRELFSEIIHGGRIETLLAQHNAVVKESFLQAGINWEKWHSFNGEERRSADYRHRVQSKDEKWLDLMVKCEELIEAFQDTPLAGAVRKDVIDITKRKKEIFSGNFLRSEENPVKKVFIRTIKSDRHCKENGIKMKLDLLGCYKRILNVSRGILDFNAKFERRQFSVRLWRRDRTDIFQGNYSDCCIAIGEKDLSPAVKLPGVPYKKYPAGVVNYLTDLGIQVAVVNDQNGPMGQCWLFVTPDKNGPILVADSFDIHWEIKEDKGSSVAAIQDCMFSFLKRYAAAVGIKRVVLGKTGPILSRDRVKIRHEIQNDVPVQDLPEYHFADPITKLGGYLCDRPYFLETCGGDSAHLIAEIN